MLRSLALYLSLALAGLAVPSAVAADDDPPLPPWERIGTDLDLAQVTVRVNPFLSSELLFIRTSLREYRVAVLKATEYGWRRNTIKALGRASRAKIAINANFFDEQGRALGLIISRGILNQNVHRGGGTLSGIFQAGPNGIKILNRSDFTPLGVSEAVQAGPRLLSGGSRVKGLREPSTFSKRSGVCIDKEQRLIFFIVSSGLLGVSIEQLQEELMKPEIGCVDALNLDGGGSSQFWMSGSIKGARRGFSEIFVQALDPVPVALGLLPKEPLTPSE